MDGKIRILKSVDNEISNLQARLLEDQNKVRNMEINLRKRGGGNSYNMDDGQVKILGN